MRSLRPTVNEMMIEITGVESKIEGLIQVLNERENRVMEVCRSGKMTMRRGHHTSRVLRAMGVSSELPTSDGSGDELPSFEKPE